MTTLYDPKTGQPVELDPNQAKQALLSGQLTVSKKDTFNLVNSKGDFIGSVPGEDLAEKLASGDFHLANPEQKKVIDIAYSEENQGAEGAAKVAAENLVNQLTFGVAGPIINANRSPEEQEAQKIIEQQHQISGALGSALGFGGSLIAGGPLFKGAGLAGEAVAEAAPKILQGTAKLGTEAAVLSAPAAVTEASLGHPDEAAEHLLYGLGAGAALGAAGSLLKPVLKGTGKIALNVLGKPFGYDVNAENPLQKLTEDQTIRALLYGTDKNARKQLEHVGSEDIAKFLHENGLVKQVGEDFQSYAKRIEEHKESLGKQIGAMYQNLDALGAPKVPVEDFLDRIESEVIGPQRKIAVAAPKVKALEKFVEDFRNAANYINGIEGEEGGAGAAGGNDIFGGPGGEAFDRANAVSQQAFADKEANELNNATSGGKYFNREVSLEKAKTPFEHLGEADLSQPAQTMTGLGEQEQLAPGLRQFDVNRLTKAGPFKALEANEPAPVIRPIEKLSETQPGISAPAISEEEADQLNKIYGELYSDLSAKDKQAIRDIIKNKNFGRNVPNKFKEFKKQFKELSPEARKYFTDYVNNETEKAANSLEVAKPNEPPAIWPGQTLPGVGEFKPGEAPNFAQRVDKGWEELANKKIPESDWTPNNWKDYFEGNSKFKREPSEADWKAYYKERFGKTPWGEEGPPLSPEQRIYLEKQTLSDSQSKTNIFDNVLKDDVEAATKKEGFKRFEQKTNDLKGQPPIHEPPFPGFPNRETPPEEDVGLTLKQLWEQRKAVDKKIFEEKRAVLGNPNPLNEEFLKIRQVLDQVIKDGGDAAMGEGNQFSGPLNQLNRQYRLLSAVHDVVDKSALSELSRRNFSLSDYLVGGFGGLMHPLGLAAGLGNKFLRENGNAIIAKYGNQLSVYLADKAKQEAEQELNRLPKILKDFSLSERVVPRLASEAGDVKNALSHLLGKEYKDDDKAIEHINYVLSQNTQPNPLEGLLNKGAPNIALSYSAKQKGVKSYLFSKIPRNPLAPGPFQEPWQPSKKQIKDFKDTVSIINNPYSIMDRVNDGSINKNHVQTLKDVYPNTFNSITNKVKQYGLQHKKMPYQKKLKLSMLLEQPLDNSLNNVQTLQKSYSAQNENKPMAASKLKNIPGSNYTQQQRIESGIKA